MSLTVVEFEEKEIVVEMSGQGPDGKPGDAGYSPTVAIDKVGTTTTITIVDANGTHTATIEDGQDGKPGTDGVSPTVSISKEGKVTTVTITDADGVHTATINDGEDGQPGPPGPSVWGVITGNLSDQTDLASALNSKANANDVYTKIEADALLANKADSDSVYTKTETDTLLDAKADVGDSYTKAEEDALLAQKANSADVYTKSQTDTLLAEKADASDLTIIKSMIAGYEATNTASRNYNSGQLVVVGDSLLKLTANVASGMSITIGTNAIDTTVDTELLLKAPVNSPALTGTPTAPTPDITDDSTRIATTAMVQDIASALTPTVIKSASGAIASFDDAAAFPLAELTAEINPVQDLHGYDAPWPAGGGKNKVDKDPSVTGKYINNNGKIVDDIAWNVTKYFPISPNTIYTLSGISGNAPAICFFDSEEIFLSGIQYSNRGEITFTTPNNAAFFKLSYRDYYTSLQLELGSSKTSYAPYSNICPISGHSTATVTRTGKNLFNKNDAGIDNGYWSTDYNNLIVGSPLPNGGVSDNVHTSAPISVKPNTTYTVVGNRGNYPSFLFLDKDLNFVSVFLNKSRTSLTFTVPNNPNIAYLRFPFDATSPDTCQLELGSVPSSYEPYQGTSITIDLNGTQYGCVLNVLTGKMTVDRVIFEGNTSMMNNSEDYPGWRNSGLKQYYGNGINTTIYGAISNIFGLVDSGHKYCSFNSTNDTLYLAKALFGNKTQTEWIAEAVDVQIVCPLVINSLDARFTVQLSPSQLSTLFGTNNIWADTGNVSLKYWTQPSQDLANAIKSLIAMSA